MSNCSDYDYGFISSPGLVRDINEDNLGCYLAGDAVLLVLADGMGGHNSGEVASKICVETLRETFLENSAANPESILRKGFKQAHAKIILQNTQDRSLRKMGATIVAAILRDSYCWYSHLGDSRLYLVESGTVTRLTRDHTVVQDMLDNGLITVKQAIGHHMAHLVSKAVGHLESEEVNIEVCKTQLCKGSLLLLCSDGLTDLVSDEEIYCLTQVAEAQKACDDLLNLVLTRGAHDNVSIQVFRKVADRMRL